YAPPNGKDYLPEALISPKLWPRVTLVWSIAYNSALVKKPPKSWMDLTKPEYGNKQIGQVFAASGGTTWTRIMFERQVMGEDYWKKQAATNPVLYPSGADVGFARARGDRDGAVALQHRLPEEEGRRAARDFLRARGCAGQSLCQRRAVDGEEPERREAVPQLVPVGGGPNLDDQGVRQPHLAQAGAGLSGRFRSQGGQGLAAELRSVREAACVLGRGVEQDLRLPAVAVVKPHSG